jgi:RNA polymerase sigma-70 factor (ECF subfamily)
MRAGGDEWRRQVMRAIPVWYNLGNERGWRWSLISHTKFVEQLEPHLGELKAYCNRLAGNVADGDDLYQTALEKAYRACNEKSAMSRAYLFRIAKNAWIDRHRAKAKAVREMPLLEGQTAHYTVNDANVREAFEVMAERLSVRQCILLLMVDVFGFTAKETAAQFGSTEGAVKEALKRARLRLARHAAEPDAGTRPKSAPSLQADGMRRQWVELFIRAFRSGNIGQMFIAYRQLQSLGIDAAKVSTEGDCLYFEFLDPNGHYMRIYAKKAFA